MTQRNVRSSFVGLAVLLATTCGGGGSSSPTAPSSTSASTSTTTSTQTLITNFSVTAANTTLQVGQTTTLTLTATFSNNTNTTVATCTPRTGTSASITATCTVTALAAGTEVFTETHQGKTASVTITVTAPTILSISASAEKTTLQVGETTVVTVTASYSNGTTVSVIPYCTPSYGYTVSITSTCSVTALNSGTRTVTAFHQGHSDSVVISVSASASLSYISVSPAMISLQPEETASLTITATYSDGTTTHVPTCTPYSNSTASVTASCTVTALRPGWTSINQYYEGRYDYISITVEEPFPPTVLWGSYGKLMIFGQDSATTYLGCLTCSSFGNPESVLNMFGYGSIFGDTIFNIVGTFGGSLISQYSVCNPYASNPPRILNADGNYLGRLTMNVLHSERTSISVLQKWLKYSVCDFNWLF